MCSFSPNKQNAEGRQSETTRPKAIPNEIHIQWRKIRLFTFLIIINAFYVVVVRSHSMCAPIVCIKWLLLYVIRIERGRSRMEREESIELRLVKFHHTELGSSFWRKSNHRIYGAGKMVCTD